MRSKVPKYVQIAEILKRRIANGNYMSQSFPGGPKLVAEFGVNYRTVRQAFQLLLDEGLLVRGENERLVQPGGAGRTPFKVAFVSSGYCCPADKWLLAVREAARKYRCMFCRVVFDTTDDAILYETLDGDFDLIFLSVGTPDGLLLDKIRQKKEKVVLLFADMSAEGIPFFDGIGNEACALIVRHLARRNCRKIDFFSVMQTPEFYTARRDVWEKTLKELNCTGEAYCVMGNVEEERFVQAHRIPETGGVSGGRRGVLFRRGSRAGAVAGFCGCRNPGAGGDSGRFFRCSGAGGDVHPLHHGDQDSAARAAGRRTF